MSHNDMTLSKVFSRATYSLLRAMSADAGEDDDILLGMQVDDVPVEAHTIESEATQGTHEECMTTHSRRIDPSLPGRSQ